jgi:zinc/manganese transport system substrate-binding protein
MAACSGNCCRPSIAQRKGEGALKTPVLIYWAALASLLFCSGSAFAQDKLSVVATFSILADMTQRVGGENVSVHALVGPEQDAHVFQPTPAAAAAVSKARLLISNGLGFEGWIERLVSSSGYTWPVVVATKGLTPLEAGDSDHNEHGHRDADPHAWQDLSNALTYVENIKTGLCNADPAHCDAYTKNASAYTAEISALDVTIKAEIGALPQAKRKVITSHDAFGYFAKAYGVTFKAPTGISTDSEASAQDVAKLIDLIKAENVTALFVESISDTRLMEQIARETGVKPGAVLYSDALSQPGGPASTYLDMMRSNALELTKAMVGP